jgi:uncharacterized protein YuzE
MNKETYEATMKEQKKQIKDAKKFIKERKTSMKKAYSILKPAIDYDPEYDILMIYFSGGQKCESTIELTPDVRVDLSHKGLIIGIEIENFSKYQKKGSFK